jgi:hypothetical protein
MDVPEVPANLGDVLHHPDEVKSRSLHTHPAAGGPAGRREAIYHGQGAGVDGAKDGLLEYFQQVDRGLHRHLNSDQAPLLLAGVEYLLPIYRQANTYAHLLEDGLEGHPDRFSARELHDRAWPVVQPHFRKARDRIAGVYRQLAGTGRTTNDVAAVVAAAHQGQIQYLFVARGRTQWGTFDPATLQVQTHDTAQPGDEDLLNLAAVHALSHRGTVYAVGPDEMPDRTPLAAVFWLPLGERGSKRTVG